VLEEATGVGTGMDIPLVPLTSSVPRPLRQRLIVHDEMEIERPATVSMTTPMLGGVEKPKSKKVKRIERSKSLTRKLQQ